MTQHLQELQNKYDSRTNATLLSRRLCVGLSFFPYFVNATRTKTVIFDE